MKALTAPKRIDPEEAHTILTRDPGAALIDVRSRVEYEYVGHPHGALHVPWKEYPDWEVNPDFVAEVRRALHERGPANVEDTPVLLLCRSGGRSLSAGEELMRNGFTRVYNIEEGFEGEKDAANHRGTVSGWRHRGLPWEQT